jgi:hypothetical protein
MCFGVNEEVFEHYPGFEKHLHDYTKLDQKQKEKYLEEFEEQNKAGVFTELAYARLSQ